DGIFSRTLTSRTTPGISANQNSAVTKMTHKKNGRNTTPFFQESNNDTKTKSASRTYCRSCQGTTPLNAQNIFSPQVCMCLRKNRSGMVEKKGTDESRRLPAGPLGSSTPLQRSRGCRGCPAPPGGL
ncbi:unnamed protein product, partial [Ectocarpus sp. 12 AP-2014]